MSKNWEKDYPAFQGLTEEGLDENNSLKKMLRLVGVNKRVIDFGCATGYFAQLLTKKGCKVTGIEINPEAAKVAEQYCEQTIVADLDRNSLTKILPNQLFDVAIFGDVLEHLRDPWRVLEETQKLLKSDGYVVASIPNIAHGAICLALLQGKFEYTELGILDNTHLRFFTRKTVEELFERSGYFVDTIDRTRLPIFSQNPLIPQIDRDEFSSDIINQIEQQEEAETLQFILRAFPSSESGKYTALSERYAKVFDRLERAELQLQHLQAELDSSLQRTELMQSQLQQTQAEKEQLQVTLQQTQAELEQIQSQAQSTQSELERSQSQAQHLQVELKQSQVHLSQTQTELNQAQAQLQQTQTEVGRSQATISGMESSKFWQLRTAWFRFKKAVGLVKPPKVNSSVSFPNLGDNVVGKIHFKVDAQNSLNGAFDGINGTTITTINVPEIGSVTATGWAVLADENRVADRVIITHGKDRAILAIVPVDLARPDVALALNNPAYRNCGWMIRLDPANLPTGKITLKAWAYNAATQEAILLQSPKLNSGIKQSFSRLKYLYALLKARGWQYAVAKLLKKSHDKLTRSQLANELLPAVFAHQDPYSRWLSKNFPREADFKRMAETVEFFSYKPKISAIVPVFNPPEEFLRQAIESVLNQVYPYWELCIADDNSTKPYVKTVLEEYSSKDPRIKVVYRNENGHISRASNSALEIATGEFVALLDHDDLLTPDAFYEVAVLLNRHPDADMIYSDEDKVDEKNQFRDPFFKPEWCPDSFLSKMYTCHLGTYRRSLVERIGGFRVGYEGSQDYDLVLRLTEKTEKIFHIPKILYHWRIHSESTATGEVGVKTYAYEAAEKAIAEALDRRGEKARVAGIPGFFGNYMVRYAINDYQLVSIIIPTKDLGNILHKCLESIFQKSVYPNYEVIVIDNGSKEENTAKILAEWQDREPYRFRCYSLDIPFNYSRINNYAASQAKGDYLLFLNNDTEVITPDWIDAMVEQAQRPSIGAVGTLLLYPDNSIQHAGIVLGLGGVAAHSHRYFPATTPGYFCHVKTISNVSAVTGACLMCRRDVFDRVGGFDEELVVAYNDVDLCIKMLDKGYRHIYLPHAVLYHYESKSRGYEDTPEKQARLHQEAKYLLSKWQKIIDDDPCYSPHLTRDREDYSINI
jgi:O-antigen biosynthesis protein